MMKATSDGKLLNLVPENTEEAELLAFWKSEVAEQIFAMDDFNGAGISIMPLGNRLDICREPINVTSKHPDESIRTIGNFADTPFFLDGQYYQSVESFWQGLKATDLAERRRIANLTGQQAKSDSSIPGYSMTLQYEGSTIVVGTWSHWQLMRRACMAKFQQNALAAEALLATGNRPLVHVIANDSKAIPGVIMANIWMEIRALLAK